VTSEKQDERPLVLPAGAGVDDRVHHTVAVAKPEDDLEEPRWRSTGRTERLYLHRKDRATLFTQEGQSDSIYTQ